MLINSMDRWVGSMLADEHGGGDGPDTQVEAELVSKSSGIMCGNSVAIRLIETHFPDCSTEWLIHCLLYTSPSPRDQRGSRMPSSA